MRLESVSRAFIDSKKPSLQWLPVNDMLKYSRGVPVDIGYSDDDSDEIRRYDASEMRALGAYLFEADGRELVGSYLARNQKARQENVARFYMRSTHWFLNCIDGGVVELRTISTSSIIITVGHPASQQANLSYASP